MVDQAPDLGLVDLNEILSCVSFQITRMVLAEITLLQFMCLSSSCKVAWASHIVAQQNFKKQTNKKQVETFKTS